jgi:hypothetical protein
VNAQASDRFWAKVHRGSAGECWTWQGPRNGTGYGRFSIGKRMVQAHRFAFEEVRGPIPEGLVLDHRCRTPLCVNPWHLDPVTHRENILRGIGPSAQNVRKTHCPEGHEYSVENTIVKGTQRHCRACRVKHDRNYKERHRSKVAANHRRYMRLWRAARLTSSPENPA